MNDFSELEAQLKALRPAPLREEFVARMEQAISEPPAAEESDKIIRPAQFRTRWMIGLGLAAAAAVLLLVRANFQTPRNETRVATESPAANVAPERQSELPRRSPEPTLVPNVFVPTGSTQVVYRKKDEGLLFAQNSEQPVRRMRSITQETLQWRNPATGASLRVSYPSEQVELIPVSGQ